jgi:hypothetical protein
MVEEWRRARSSFDFPVIAVGAVCVECLRAPRSRTQTGFMTPNLATHVRRTPHESSEAVWWTTHPVCRWHAVPSEKHVIYTLVEYAELRAAERVRRQLAGG